MRKRENGIFINERNEMNIWIYHNKVIQDEISTAHYHKEIELNIVLQGELQAFVDNKWYIAKEGQIFCFASMEPHFFHGIKDSEILCLVISSKFKEDFDLLFNKKNITYNGLPLFLQDKDKNKEILDMIFLWDKTLNERNSLEIMGFVNLLFGIIVREYGFRDLKKGVEKNTIIFQILDYVDKNYKQEITLDLLASELKYSRTSISRYIHQIIRMDIRTYVNFVRVEKFRQIMNENPDMNVMTCAFECGFNNMASFYRTYKQRFGRSPKMREEDV